MSKIKDWLSGWATTLHIMIFERELYHQLTEPLEEGDLTEVTRPEGNDDD